MMTGLRAHTPYNGIFKNGKKVRRPTIQLTHGVGIYAGQRRVKRGKGHGDRRCNEPGGGGIYAWYWRFTMEKVMATDDAVKVVTTKR